MTAKAFISGCAGRSLSADEIAFFRDERPWGLILFKRNIGTAEEVCELVATFREALGDPDRPVLIDQEGGRVQRIGPPLWKSRPAARYAGILHAEDEAAGRRMAWLHARLIAADLLDLGVTVDCLPVVDVATPRTHQAIGDRAFADDPDRVALLGRAVAEGLEAGGVLPVMKHMPGHGRATADSHYDLPSVDVGLETLKRTDFAPFRALADLPMAMTAHILFTAIDPDRPATTSPRIVEEIIRGWIGFDGLLMSDDLSMQALGSVPGLGSDFSSRASAVLAAGCDTVLHCNGLMDEMRAVAAAVPELAGRSAERAATALAARKAPHPLDRESAEAEYATLAERAGWPPATA
ncbi:beta-N-acetylhexosaminidase [Kaistia dalseonensis]|uniref:beta-N-acetylhexosaminidase n=1 Tax=Kaistia dalseonensis TaxID=410840 RepID=A0ABU0H2N6_9HYPH|nr:beta-N-acetylhexosaminidase [Kaistia dalseonensis]MCX5493593.1 beta-N-acetylhexosaminidase [Kaistia dalseonensis]MDQ0436153.1 beta-N-acetylhexosaminidase [Kaistia dalseonensis]